MDLMAITQLTLPAQARSALNDPNLSVDGLSVRT